MFNIIIIGIFVRKNLLTSHKIYCIYKECSFLRSLCSPIYIYIYEYGLEKGEQIHD